MTTPILTPVETKESWINTKWRPLMGWVYAFICVIDFVVFPILWSIFQAKMTGSVNMQWDPLTLKGAGLFHISMGAVLGVTSWQRGIEKSDRYRNNLYNNGRGYERREEDTADYRDRLMRDSSREAR